MFYSINQFPFLISIREKVNEISQEFQNAIDKLPQLKEFMQNKEPELYSHVWYWAKETEILKEYTGYDPRPDNGAWGAFPLFKEGFPIKWYNVYEIFPVTIKLVESVPDVYFSSFMRLSPGASGKPHKHAFSHLIFHLNLFDLDKGSIIECGNQKAFLKKKGDYAIFNYKNTHNSENMSSIDRVHLVIDFRYPIDSSQLELMQERIL
jgi:hypothetical protein